MYVCSVCSYQGLHAPPEDFLICPCCGTQFGYHDATRSHSQLRLLWVEKGAKWHSRAISGPPNWDARLQLNNGLAAIELPESPVVSIGQDHNHFFAPAALNERIPAKWPIPRPSHRRRLPHIALPGQPLRNLAVGRVQTVFC